MYRCLSSIDDDFSSLYDLKCEAHPHTSPCPSAFARNWLYWRSVA